MNTTTTKHEQIYDYLRGAIDSGEFKQGELLPADLQIAAKFEASRPTVAKAVRRLVEEKRLGRRAGYGTFIHDKWNRQLSLGLLIPGLGTTEIFEPICAQIASMAASNHFNLIWGGGGSTVDMDHRNAEQLAQRFVDQKIDGVFFKPVELIKNADSINQTILKIFHKATISVVLLDADVVEYPLTSDYDLIGIDNVEAGYTAAKHLIESGCKSIGFVNRSYVAKTVVQRIMGAREAVERSQLGSNAFSILEIEGNGNALAARLASGGAPEGIICYNDATAGLLMLALIESGVSIPGDIRMIGFDDVKYAVMFSVPLTTYRQPCADLGRAAVETMLSRITNPKLAPMRTLIKGQLIVRKSSGYAQEQPHT